MNYKRVLTIQDISCLGQCSATVALPIISACGHECLVIPSAVLSTHTGGFTGYTFRDLTDDIPKINRHWEKEGIKVDCVYTGYLGSTRQIEYVEEIMDNRVKLGGIRIVDPAMADLGKLYAGFDMEYVSGMAGLCTEADIILPNITEACLMTGKEYKETYDTAYIMELLASLEEMGAKCVILTGVGYRADSTGVVIYEHGAMSYYEHEKISGGCHGTGDVYASAFTGALMREMSAVDAAVIAADYTVECIKATQSDSAHWYGVKFETQIPKLIETLSQGCIN